MNRTFSIHRKYKQIWTVKNIITNSIRKSSKTKQNIRNYNDRFKKPKAPGINKTQYRYLAKAS